ncbi:MAG: HAD family phosphatase [Deltaproteobacteria bacterium]
MEQSIAKNSKIDVVLFDFGGVLSAEGWKKGLTVIAKANGLSADRLIQTAADTIYETGYITGKCSESDFWNALKIKTGIRGDNTSLRHELMSRFVLDDRMMDLARKLRAANLTVGILSDQTDWLDQLNVRFDFFKYFDHVFNSYHLGKGKRDSSLFDDVAGFLKTSPNRILFIDDDPGNVKRARQKGWQAILYGDAGSFYSEMDKVYISVCKTGQMLVK